MNGIDYLFSGCLVTAGEAICYVLLVGLLSLLHLSESCLVNTFSFTFYWGFKELTQSISVLRPSEANLLALYLVSGVVLSLALNLYFLKRGKNKTVGSPLGLSLGNRS